MYYKSLIAFVLSTIFVAGFVVVLNYDASGVGRQSAVVITSQATCPPTSTSCETLSITSATLRAVNYTDELGVVNYATLTIGLEASGVSAITGVDFFIGNVSAGYIPGPFQLSVNNVLSLTIPATISVSAGKTYVVSAEGFYGSGSAVWTSTRVTAA